ncbi:MAG: cobalt ECF transporter T component CbiQ [Candidatus Omnitrophica bacterium]|nr:cobalt ECF transporter T component CbiQ [Candidatus Omnitrophota bacterium]
MRHSFIDEFSNLDSLITRLDPRIKIISFILLILSIIFTRPESFYSFGLFLLLIFILIYLSRVPPFFILKRSLVIVPFVLMIAIFIPFFKKGQVAGAYSFGTLKLTVSYGGLLILWNVFIKSFLSVLVMITLVSTTRFVDMLKSLEKLKCPKLFIMIMSFMYRYVFLFVDELLIMNQAKDSRMVGKNRWFNIKILANMIGSLFVRSYERGERVYLAMCSRGYNGTIRIVNHFYIKASDWMFLILLISIIFLIKIIT